MALLAFDSFDRADNSNLGTDWDEASGGFEIVSNRLKLITHNAADDVCVWIRAIGCTPAPDYEVEAIVQFNGGGGGGTGVAGRYQDMNNYYLVEASTTGDSFDMYKKVSGSYTKIGAYAVTLNEATDYTVKLGMVGTTIKGYLNGVERISVTDSSITAAGRPACRGFSNNNGQLYNDFAVYGAALPIVSRTFSYNNAVKGSTNY